MSFDNINSHIPYSNRSTSASTSSNIKNSAKIDPSSLAGSNSDQLARLLNQNAKDKSLILELPIPTVLKEKLQLVPPKPGLEPGEASPKELVTKLCANIESVVPVERIYVYGGLLREQLSAKDTRQLACDLTESQISESLFTEPKERVPDADIAIKITINDVKTYHAVKNAIIRGIAAFYPKPEDISDYAHEQNVFSNGLISYVQTKYPCPDKNQFFLVRIGDGKLKNIEIKVYWELARTNLFSITGWQADWDYKSDTLSALSHSDNDMKKAAIDWITRNIRAENAEAINEKGWARYISFLCSDFTSNQIELEAILWNTLNQTLAEDRAKLLLENLIACLKTHYPHDYDFSVQFLFYASLALNRQAEADLVRKIWNKETWAAVIEDAEDCYVSVLLEKMTSSTSVLWKEVATWLFQNPNDLPLIEDLFAVAAFFKLGTQSTSTDAIQKVELTNHRGELHWHLTFRSNFRSTLLIPVYGNTIGKKAISRLQGHPLVNALFALPATASVDPRSTQLGINFKELRRLIPNNTCMATNALRWKLDELEQTPLNDSHLDEALELLKLSDPNLSQLATYFKDLALPLTRKAINNKADENSTKLGYLCDLAAASNPLFRSYAINKFNETKIPPTLAKGVIRFIQIVAESSIDTALDLLFKNLGNRTLTPALCIEAFTRFASQYRPANGENDLSIAQTLTRFYRCSKLLRLASTEPFHAACTDLIKRTLKNQQFSAASHVSSWQWYSELNNTIRPDEESALIISFVESASPEELNTLWEKIETSGILGNAGLASDWTEPCLKLLEKTILVRSSRIPQSTVWERLKKTQLTSEQTRRLESCVQRYHDFLSTQKEWFLAINHHANNPRNDLAYVQTWIELLTKLNSNKGPVWNYTEQVCEVADRVGSKAKNRVLQFYLENLPREATKHTAIKQWVSVVHWCKKTLCEGDEAASTRLGRCAALLKAVQNWDVEGLAESILVESLLVIAPKIDDAQKCPSDSVAVLCDAGSKYAKKIDDNVRFALLKLVYSQETYANSWAFTLNTLASWQLPLSAPIATVILSHCTNVWKSCSIISEDKYDQLQKIEDRCAAGVLVDTVGDLRNSLVLTVFDQAVKEKKSKIAAKALQKFDNCTGNKGEVTDRHRNYVALKIAQKEILDVIGILSQGSFACWENEWLLLIEGETQLKGILSKLCSYLSEIRNSNRFELWKQRVASALMRMTQQDAVSAAEFMAGFESILPPSSFELMNAIIIKCAATRQQKVAEELLVKWITARPNEENVRKIWLSYLNSSTTKTVDQLIEWLESIKNLFVLVNIPDDQKYLLLFKWVGLMLEAKGSTVNLTNLMLRVAKLLKVDPAGPSETSNFSKLWLTLYSKLLQTAASGGDYERLANVFDLVGTCSKFAKTDEELAIIQRTYGAWSEAVVQYILECNNRLNDQTESAEAHLDDLAKRALFVLLRRTLTTTQSVKPKNSNEESNSVVLTKQLLRIFIKLGRFYPSIQKEKTPFNEFMKEISTSPAFLATFIEFVISWLKSDRINDYMFALTLLKHSNKNQKELGLLFEPIWKSLNTMTQSNTDTDCPRVAFILGSFTNWGYYSETKLYPQQQKNIARTNRDGLRLVLDNSISNPVFPITTAAQEVGFLSQPAANLKAGNFYATQLEYIKEILRAIEAYPDKQFDLVIYACQQATLLIRAQEQADTYTHTALTLILDDKNKMNLNANRTAIVIAEGIVLLSLAAEKGYFSGKRDSYQKIYKKLFDAEPSVDPDQNAFAARAELWDGLCKLSSKLSQNKLPLVLYLQMHHAFFEDLTATSPKRVVVISRLWKHLESYVLHRVKNETDEELRLTALSFAYMILIKSLIYRDFESDIHFNALYKRLFGNECKIKPGTYNRILGLINEILTVHLDNQMDQLVIPQLIKILDLHGTELMKLKPQEFLKILDKLIPIAALAVEMVDPSVIENLFSQAIDENLYRANPQLLLTHGMLLRSDTPKFVKAVDAAKPKEKKALLEVLLERFVDQFANHSQVIDCYLEIMENAMESYGVTISLEELLDFHAIAVSQLQPYISPYPDLAIQSINLLLEDVFKLAAANTIPAEELFDSFIERGFLDRDLEFENALKINPENTKATLNEMIEAAFNAVFYVLRTVRNTDIQPLLPVWFEKIIAKGLHHHSKADCPDLRKVLVENLEKMQTLPGSEKLKSLIAQQNAAIDKAFK